MAKYSAVKATVNAYIKQNGRKEITGRILNAVLNATIDSLGKYFQFAGGALPTDDPGTPDQNVCYLAGEPGVYTNFGGITIENEEVALLFWNGEWTKQRILIGIREVNASVDDQVGTPSVDVNYSQGQLVLTFHNLKGNKGDTGDPAGFGTIGADINGGVGTPGVSVETSGDNTAKNLMFHFTNLKGETGVTSVVATIDNTSGTPSCQVSLVNGVLTLAFSGLKGLKGDTGVSADYPITIYNGLDSDATDQALAAAQGKVLDGKVSQLDQKVTDLDNVLDTAGTRERVLATGATNNSYVNYQTGAVTSSSTNKSTDGIDVSEYHGRTIQYLQNVYPGTSGSVGMAFYDSNNTFVSGVPCHFGGSAEGVEETTTIVPNNATYAKFTIFKDYADSFYVKALGDYHSERLDEIEDIVNNLIQDADTEDDFDISDEEGNIIARFLDGDVRTKNFDSSKSPEIGQWELGDFSIEDESGECIALFDDGEIKTKNFDSSILKSEDDEDSDFSVQDNDGNIILGIVNGYPTTKNFNGKQIENRVENLETGGIEEWSKMPALGDNPLSFVRFDGGMGRIFRNWGFIGDSLNSGEMYGKQTEILSLSAEHQNTAISGGALVAETGSVVTEQYQVSAYLPRLRLVFASSSGLSGKILAASVQNGAYTTLITGSGNTTYTISLSSGRNIVISYPSDNVPQILFGSTFVQDMYDLSWGQQMARLLGSAGYNFSVGGEYCKRWCIGEDNDRRWQKAQTALKDAYTIALGVNDRGYWLDGATSVVNYPCVTAYPNQNQYGALTITKADVLADIDLDDYTYNADSYAGWYAGIIQRLKSIRPDSHIFCITNPGEGGGKEWNQTIRLVVEIMQEKYGNTIWLIDLATYNPNTPEINANCNLNGHWSAFGYLYAAYEISTYIDWLIRKNIDAFRGSSLIGTGSSAKEWTII